MEGIDFPDFQPETLEKLKALLPSYASPANPLDTTATISYECSWKSSSLCAKTLASSVLVFR